MDQIKIGSFLAQLRKEKKLTQETLGEKIGVTNKTISRWENGNYMPDIEMLQILSKTFHVSINELLSGERLSNEQLRIRADINLVEMWKCSSFALKDRVTFWKKKWLKDHIVAVVIGLLIYLIVLIVAILKEWGILMGTSTVFAAVIYIAARNQMMIYVEAKAFDPLL